MVVFTDHSKTQMQGRGIAESEVRSVLSNPVETIRTRGNRSASYSSVQGKYIVVIHEKLSRNEDENPEEMIITAMKVDRRRLGRFGFTQVR